MQAPIILWPPKTDPDTTDTKLTGAPLSTIFISHSSKNNPQAIALRAWLIEQGWSKSQIFLDLDDLHSGQRWREQLNEFGAACEAVIVCLSDEWLDSLECVREFNHAESLGKAIFPIVISPITKTIPRFITDIQMADISAPEIAPKGYSKLKAGLTAARIAPGQFAWPPPNDLERAPYRGLHALTEEDAAIFFGRDLEITRGLDTLRRLTDRIGTKGSPRLLTILGASGAGKSSFLRAGLLARLRRNIEQYVVLPVVRPGVESLSGPEGLLNALSLDNDVSDGAIREALQKIKHQQLEPAGQAPNTAERVFILPIDQAEELFALGSSQYEDTVSLINRILDLEPNLLILLTIRSDQFSLLQENKTLGSIAREPFDLPPVSVSAMKEVIVGPGSLCDPVIAIEDALVERLIRDLGDHGSLPLLAFALERLFIKFGNDAKLTAAHYLEDLGGIEGAIDAAVEAAFLSARRDPALPNSRATLEDMARHIFIPALVKLETADASPMRAIARNSSLSADQVQLLNHFLEQRLLSAGTMDGNTTYEVTHEAVLRHWPALTDWIDAERGSLVRLERLKQAAFAYANQPTDENIVHRGEALRQLNDIRSRPTYLASLDDAALHYLEICDLEEEKANKLARKNRLLSKIIPLTSLATLAGLLGMSILVNNLARGFSDWRASSLVPAANRAAELGQNDLALRLAIAAVPPPNATAPANNDALTMLQLTTAIQTARMDKPRTQSFKAAAFDTKSNYVFVGSSTGVVTRLSIDAPDPFSNLQLQTDGDVSAMAVSPSGDWLAAASGTGSIYFWRLPDDRYAAIAPEPACVISTPKTSWRSLSFDQGESQILAAGSDRFSQQGIVGVINLRECSFRDLEIANGTAQPLKIEWRSPSTFSVLDIKWQQHEYALDNPNIIQTTMPKFAASCGDLDCDYSVRAVYSAATNNAAYRRSGFIEVFNGTSSTVFNRPDPCTDRNENGPEAQIYLTADARFQRLLIMCDDGRMFAWQEPRAPIPIQTAAIFSTISNTGRVTAEFGFDGKLYLRFADGTSKSTTLPNRFAAQGITAMAASDDGDMVAIAATFNSANEGTPQSRVYLFEMMQNEIQLLGTRRQTVTRLRFSADNQNILASGWDEQVCVHAAKISSTAYPGHCFGLAGITGTDAAWSPDADTIATIGNLSSVPVIWDAATGKQLSPSGQPRPQSPFWFLTYAQSHDYIVAGGERGTLQHWALPDERSDALVYAGSFIGHTNTIHEAVFSPEGKLMASLGADQTIRIWDVATGRNTATSIFPARNIAWPDEGLRASGDHGSSVLVPISQSATDTRRDACQLIGQNERRFSNAEINRFPALRPGDCSPCDNVGTLSLRYWLQALPGGSKLNTCRPT